MDDILTLCAGEATTPKSKGHWIGRFTVEEYTAICKVFGREYTPPKDLKLLLMAIANGKIGLYDKAKYELIEK